MKHINYLLIAMVAIAATGCKKYHQNQGTVFGTYYNIQYQSFSDIQPEIDACLAKFDSSLSVYNEQSIISKINRNEEVETDAYFDRMFETAQYVSEVSNGGFDITVAPLVNAWGFGFQHKQDLDDASIDSIKQFIDFKGVSLVDHHVKKSDPRTMLDASAIAKGYACDIVAELLESKGCLNYKVDIGGEIIVKGHSNRHKPWVIGITKPIDDVTGEKQELQDAIETIDLCMATSGNYRNYYIENGVRRSHTIDPRTGYPVHHNLLSATVIAPSCIKADALATACMVLGEHDAAVMLSQIRDVAYYFIIADTENMDSEEPTKDGNIKYIIKTSQNWEQLLHGEEK